MEPLLFLEQLLFPLVFLMLSIVHIPITIFKALINRQYSIFQSVSAFKDAWFAEFWKVIGSPCKTTSTPNILPLLESANGVVLGKCTHLHVISQINESFGQSIESEQMGRS